MHIKENQQKDVSYFKQQILQYHLSMNKIKQLQANSPIKISDSSSFYQKNQFNLQKPKVNPEDDIKTSHINNSFLKLLNYDNGNAVKDFKSILDNIKDQVFFDKQKINLFYEDGLKPLLSDLKIQNIHIQKMLDKKQTEKTKKISLKKSNYVFQSYKSLMSYCLRQNQKAKHLKLSSKKKFLGQKIKFQDKNQKNRNITNRNLPINDEISSFLEKFVFQIKKQLTIQEGSSLKNQQNELIEAMRNRRICQNLFSQALLFQRYYDILKKESKQIENQKNKSQLRMRKQQDNLSFPKSKSTSIRKPIMIGIRKKSQKNWQTLNAKQNSFCIDPKHERLSEQSENERTSWRSEQDYNRNKLMHKLKKGLYYKQLRKVNEEFIEKKNQNNQKLISSLLNFIRGNSIKEEKAQQMVYKKQFPASGYKKPQLQHTKESFRNSKQNRTNIIKTFKKIFLIYCFLQNQQIQSTNQYTLSHQNLTQFFIDFRIDIIQIIKTNQKIRQILQEDTIHQFQFIQLMHLLSVVFQESNDGSLHNQEQTIYTNIQNFFSIKISNQSYIKFSSIQQQKMIRGSFSKTINNLRKLHQFNKKLCLSISYFLKSQNVNELKVASYADDFDNVLEVFWFLKIYPMHINKRKAKFYFDYLKDEFESYFTQDRIEKTERYYRIQVIIWFVVCSMMIEQRKKKENDQNEHSVKEIYKRSEQKILIGKFKMILKEIKSKISSKKQEYNNQ